MAPSCASLPPCFTVVTTLLLLTALLFFSSPYQATAVRIEAKVAETLESERDWEFPERAPSREPERLESELADRANLFFRRLDTDYDHRIGEEDARRGEEALREHMPGVSLAEFLEFIKLADQDQDQHLSRHEFLNGIAEGLSHTDLLETQASVAVNTNRKVGFIGAVGKAVGNFLGQAGSQLGRTLDQSVGIVDKSQDGCVMCQYIVERIETNVKASGVIPGMTGLDPFAGASFLEEEAIPLTQSKPALLEVASEQQQQQQDVPHTIGAGIISATRQSTRYQRQMERQKFNEIYRVTDITLDDVCEQGMPNVFYGYCKEIYKAQSDVVDGLRYQYRPADICFRIGMCGKKSYITKGVHSRYQS